MALAAVVALPSLANGFVYDDVLIIQQNPLVHGLARSAEIWHSSYWPSGLLYRPLTSQLFGLEWAIGGGRPLVFHAVNILLAVAAAVLVFRLASRLLPPPAAVVAAAFFALHPVHVEAVANAVGQSELLVAVLSLIAVDRYLGWREGAGLTPGRRLALGGLTLLAILTKETGFAVPILLGLAELTLRRDPRRAAGSTFILQGAAVTCGLLLRTIAVGNLVGENPATVFQGLGTGGRAVGMLAVVPEWARLLLWPVHLQAEYGPPSLSITGTVGAAHVLGIVLLVLFVAVALRALRRDRVMAFGLLWMAVALAPVSNIVATGLVLAERTLFLPSAGVSLAVGALVARLLPRFDRATRAVRVGAGVAAILLLSAGAALSVIRARAWRSQEEFFAGLLRDAPGVYRAHYVASRYHYGGRRFSEAEREARQALALYQRDARVHEQLGQILRVQGRCAEALPVLAEGLRLDPAGTTVRSRLIECTLATGDTARARAVAEEAVRLGQPEFRGTIERLSAPQASPPLPRSP